MTARLKVALIHDAQFPVAAYGGTERVVWWLSKALSESGVDVTLVCRPGSSSPYARILPDDFSAPRRKLAGVDVLHFFNTPSHPVEMPYVVTIGGNGKPGETFHRNTVFVSRNHAERHGSTSFVYNGVDPDEYEFSARKEKYLLFLAKAAWRVKNVRGAIRIARAARYPLHIVGGSAWIKSIKSWRGVHWEGMLGGAPKKKWITSATGLLFPVIWHEPFGLAVVESLVSGTPVLASPFGSLPELVPGDVGRICGSEEEFTAAVSQLGEFRGERCRDWALANFHYRIMGDAYRERYARVLRHESLNDVEPATRGIPETFLPLPVQRREVG